VPPKADWFTDANATGLGHTLAAAHLPVTWIGDDGRKHRRKQTHWLQPCPVTNHGEADDVWIPKIAAYGAAILTRDERIATRLLEHEAVRRSAARMFAITSGGSLSLWEMVQVVAARWAWLEEKRLEPGPVIYGFTRTTDHVVTSW
jgi:hypothetical protein